MFASDNNYYCPNITTEDEEFWVGGADYNLNLFTLAFGLCDSMK